MRFPVSALLFAAFPLAAPAQTPPPGQGAVTAEATEVVRAKPDRARVTFTVSVKGSEAMGVSEENDAVTKQFVEAIDKLKLGGVKANPGAVRIDRVETQPINGGIGGGVQFVPSFHAARPVVVTVEDADPAKLRAAVDKVQQEGAKQGVSGEPGNSSYNGRAYERTAGVRVTCARTEGWDDLTAAALTKATRKATQRAEAMAAGAGLKLGEVISIGEPTDPAPQTVTTYNYAGSGSALAPTQSADSLETYVDGELVRKIRVRVVYATSK